MVAHGVVRHPLGLLNRLIERAKVGQFVPNRSLSGSQSMLASDKNLSRPAADACTWVFAARRKSPHCCRRLQVIDGRRDTESHPRGSAIEPDDDDDVIAKYVAY
jgi:hypothetical protein